MADQMPHRTASACAVHAAGTSARALDYLYNEIDKLYHVYARGCGVSDCAYWMLYDLEIAGGALPLAELTASWSYSKQTINSALKALKDKGLVDLPYMEGSRKSKQACLTADGRAFSSRHIVPAIRAEERAFSFLAPDEQDELIRLVRRYVDALDAQLAAVEGAEAPGGACPGDAPTPESGACHASAPASPSEGPAAAAQPAAGPRAAGARVPVPEGAVPT